MLLAFHKPFGVLSQFTPDGSANRTLAEFVLPAKVYPIGRLDADSEGLLLLSDEAKWNERLLHPSHHVTKIYWALVERFPTPEALWKLSQGVVLDGRATLPAEALLLEPQPVVGERNPPVRVRKSVQDYWIELRIMEGRNRQVRRMTAAVGHPTIRLIRQAVGEYHLGELAAGTWRVEEA